MTTITIDVNELPARFAEAIASAEQGNDVIISAPGHPSVRFIPIPRPARPKANVGGWKWLLRHKRRDEILIFVANRGETPSPSWLKTDPRREDILRDRSAVQSNLDGKSLREVAELVGKTHEWVRNCKIVYTEFNTDIFAKRYGLDLRAKARNEITRDVLRDYDAGSINSMTVARLLGENVTARHARYWIERMRVIFQRRDNNLPERASGTE